VASEERIVRRVGLALLLSLVLGWTLAGCRLLAPSNGLTGVTWRLTSITDNDPPFEAVVSEGDQGLYTIVFDPGGTYVGNADCNAIAGTYELGRRDRITLTAGASTVIPCSNGSYGTLYAHAITTAATYDVGGGTLILRSRDGGALTYTLAPIAAPPTTKPTAKTTAKPTTKPTAKPTTKPTAKPTPKPTAKPTAKLNRTDIHGDSSSWRNMGSWQTGTSRAPAGAAHGSIPTS
jgi:heat shock protein HslJ